MKGERNRKLFEALKGAFPGLLLEENFSFRRHTTVGCGGVAAVAAYPASEEEGAALLGYLKDTPHIVLGLGANVLPRDGVYEGVVVRFSRLQTLAAEDGLLFAGAGVTGNVLLRYAETHGLGGLEPFAGIPMSVGGATAMNAGVPERHLADVAVRVLAAEGRKLRLLSAAECGFSEKNSNFGAGLAVLGVYLRTEPREPHKIREAVRARLGKRRALPAGRSMGCTFVNPEGRSAGALIEACGLKGLRCGMAYVSEAHANFIINEGECAADVARLVDAVKEEVLRQTGIALREEIRRLP